MNRFSNLPYLMTLLLALTMPGTTRSHADTPGLLKIKAHKCHVMGIVFSPDGKVLASGGLDGMIGLWDPITGKEIRKFQAHKEGVLSIAFSPDGKVLASSGAEPVIRLWDPATGQEVRQLKGHTDKVASIAFSPDGKMLASGSYDKTIRLWDASGHEVRQLLGHGNRVTSLAFSPDGKHLVAGALTGDPITMPGGGKFISGWADYVRLWNPATGDQIRKFEIKGYSVAFSSDGRTIMAGGLVALFKPEQNGRVGVAGENSSCLADALTGDVIRTMKWRGSAVAVSPDARMFATGSGSTLHTQGFGVLISGGDYSLRVSDSITGKPILDLPEESPLHIAFSPNSRTIAASNYDGQVLLFDLPTCFLNAKPESRKLGSEELNALWNDLATDEPARAYRAISTLVTAPDQAVAFLGNHLSVFRLPTHTRIEELLRQLDDSRFTVRDSAVQELKRLGRGVEPAIRKALEATKSIDSRRALHDLLASARIAQVSSEELPAIRAIQVLEHISSEESRKLLARLTAGSPHSLATQHAKAALERTKRND